MRKITVDCSPITDKAALHAALKEALCFPQWYGSNLDALHDCLTEISEPTELTLLNWQLLNDRLGSWAAQFVYVLHISSEENPCFRVTLD